MLKFKTYPKRPYMIKRALLTTALGIVMAASVPSSLDLMSVQAHAQDSTAADRKGKRQQYKDEKRKIRQLQDINRKGTKGGTEVTFDIPTGGTVTGVDVFHTDDRVFGFRVIYSDRNGDAKKTDVIGGDAGTKSSFSLSEATPLRAIRLNYGPDPEKHYLSPVLLGMEFDAFNADPASSDVSKKSYGNVSSGYHTNTSEISLERGQSLDYLSACISPNDRNGRVFSLSLATNPTNGAAYKVGEFKCSPIRSSWDNQPLGPKRLPDAFGNEVPDLYEMASGLYLSKPADFKLIGNPNDAGQAFRVSEINYKYFDFGDNLTMISERGGAETGEEFKLMADPKLFGDYDFVYERVMPHPKDDVRLETRYGVKARTLDLGRNSNETPQISFTIDRVILRVDNATGAVERAPSFSYTEVPMQGPGGFVASRDRNRSVTEETGQSMEGLFEQASIIKLFGYMYTGYDFVNMSPENYNDGLKGAIFEKAGPYQYYLPSKGPAAVPDGLFYIDNRTTESDSKTFSLSSGNSIEDSTSKNLGGTVPIKGIPVGVNHSTKKSKSLDKNKSSERSFTVTRQISQIYANDLPNAFLSKGFANDLLCLYESVENGQSCNRNTTQIAKTMIQTYGTHYAHAIAMGGIAIETRETTSESVVQALKQEEETKVTVGDEKAAGLSSGLSTSSANTDKNSEKYSTTKFTSVGGQGANLSMWGTDPDSAVPFLYDLKPLSRLMSIITFNKAKDIYRSDPKRADLVYNQETIRGAVVALNNAMESYIVANTTPRSKRNVNSDIYVYKLEISGPKCYFAGDDDEEVEIKVNDEYSEGLVLDYMDKNGKLTESLTIWKPTVETAMECSKTGGRTNTTVTRTAFVDVPTHAIKYRKSGFAVLRLDGLKEVDGIKRTHDPIVFKDGKHDLGVPPKHYRFTPPKTLRTFRNDDGESPELGFSYRWQRIKVD